MWSVETSSYISYFIRSPRVVVSIGRSSSSSSSNNTVAPGGVAFVASGRDRTSKTRCNTERKDFVAMRPTSSVEDISSEVHNFLCVVSRFVSGTDASHENGRGSHIVCLSCRNRRLFPCQM